MSLFLLCLCAAVLDTALARSDKLNVCTTAAYLKRLRALKCNHSYGQQLMDVYLHCGYNEMALMEYSNCGVRNGEFCFDVADKAQEYQLAVDSFCFDTYGKPTCHSICQAALWKYRDNVGCCINNLYNASEEPIYNDRTASNLLWTACDVTPLDGWCESTLDREKIHDTVVCVWDEVLYRKKVLDCSPGYGQAFVDLFRECGYVPQLQHAVNICGVNSDDRYCFELVNDGNTLAADVLGQCVQTTDNECAMSCQVALDNFRRELSCCMNNLYNDKDNAYFSTTSPALWKTCKIKRPSFCKTTISMTGGASELTHRMSAAFTITLTLCISLFHSCTFQ